MAEERQRGGDSCLKKVLFWGGRYMVALSRTVDGHVNYYYYHNVTVHPPSQHVSTHPATNTPPLRAPDPAGSYIRSATEDRAIRTERAARYHHP